MLSMEGIDADGDDRQIHVSVNWIPQTEEFGRIKYSGSDPKEGYLND